MGQHKYSTWRGPDLNRRPLAHGASELPLLHPATFNYIILKATPYKDSLELSESLGSKFDILSGTGHERRKLLTLDPKKYLNQKDINVLALILDHYDNGLTYLTVEEISHQIKLDPEEVFDHIAKLSEVGFVSIDLPKP